MMSSGTNANDASNQATTPESSNAKNIAMSQAKQRARRKALQSGFSLLARGEPQIWFTGGMLAICLAMIASLMALILASGLPTFWPREIDLVALSDGTFEIGEPQRTSTAANEDSGTDPATSYYYRIENFDLTNQHYRWLEADEVKHQGIVRVPEAILLERFEWGYLYGFPLRLHERLALGTEDQQQLDELADAANLFQFIASSLQSVDAASDNDVAAKNQEVLQRATMILQQQLQTDSNKFLRQIIDQATEEAGRTRQVQVSDANDWRSANLIPELSKDSAASQNVNLSAARVVITDREQVIKRLQAQLPTIRYQRSQLSKLKRNLSRLDERISQFRIAVRQAELDTDSVLPVQLEAAHYPIEQLNALNQQRAKIEAIKGQLVKLVNDPELAKSLTAICTQVLTSSLPALRKSFEEQLAQWREPLADAPQAIQLAVEKYEQEYGLAFVAKLPIEKSIEILRRELESGEVVFAVPSNAKPLNDLPPTEAIDFAAGKISATGAEQLKANGVELAADSAQLVFSQAPLSLVAIADQSGANHLLGVVDRNYLSEGAASVSLLGEHPVPYEQLVRVIEVNRLSLFGKLSVYVSRWGEFLFDDPREANTLGGVFPAIWGTIVMTLIMTIAVVPFGVMAALYLREYTRGGTMVSIIRISINNLAGVPSIVYGVFGFSFFCMTIGSFIDGGPAGADIIPWPSAKWYGVLTVTVVVGTAAFFASFLSSGPSHSQTPLTRFLGKAALFLWLGSIAATVLLIFKSPFFEGLYAAQLPNPTFGKGGLLWASLTLALLTLPVVIVATEEALSAVPNSLREGSLACGASKWQTIRRIVLPHARPGILTGAILAMARGAGEVAPLMLVGALPNAPELPLDGDFPFFHGSRNFMHLGYQIYSLGFQSQNSEAAKPMVFTCTLLLILIIAALNLSAIFLRSRLRRRFMGNQF